TAPLRGPPRGRPHPGRPCPGVRSRCTHRTRSGRSGLTAGGRTSVFSREIVVDVRGISRYGSRRMSRCGRFTRDEGVATHMPVMTPGAVVTFHPRSPDFTRLVNEQNRDTVPDRVGQSTFVADQFVCLGIVTQRSLTLRAGQDLQEPVVDLRALGVLVPRGSCTGWSGSLCEHRSTHDARSGAYDGQDLVAQGR